MDKKRVWVKRNLGLTNYIQHESPFYAEGLTRIRARLFASHKTTRAPISHPHLHIIGLNLKIAVVKPQAAVAAGHAHLGGKNPRPEIEMYRFILINYVSKYT